LVQFADPWIILQIWLLNSKHSENFGRNFSQKSTKEWWNSKVRINFYMTCQMLPTVEYESCLALIFFKKLIIIIIINKLSQCTNACILIWQTQWPNKKFSFKNKVEAKMWYLSKYGMWMWAQCWNSQVNSKTSFES
jgi:hypothetical protein